jgi:hypothetical protein
VKKLISIGVALALLAMVVLPVGVAAQAPYLQPDTYAKIPFAIIAAGFDLLGEILDMEEAKVGFIGFDVGQFMGPIATFTRGPLAWSVDMLAWGVDVVAQAADPIITNFASGYSWIIDVFEDVYCKMLMPWGALNATCP